MTIDLHLTKDIISSPFYEPKNSLSIQLEIFEKGLDDALVMGLNEFRVIHGIGEGILKNEIYKICKKHKHVFCCTNEYHSLYGYGSSKIIFK